jgi:phage FluMu gp28-like protein
LLESQQRNSQARHNRLHRGMWVRNEGNALPIEDIKEAVTLAGPPSLSVGSTSSHNRYADRRPSFSGLDLSTKRDRSAFVVLQADQSTQRVELAHVRSWKPGPAGIDLQAVRQHVIEMAKQFRCPVYFDPHQAHLLAADLRSEGIECVEVPFTGPNCNEMASVILQTFRERRIDLWRDEQLIADLGRLCIVEKSFGYKLEASHDPNAGHADSAMALAIALPRAMHAAVEEAVYVDRVAGSALIHSRAMRYRMGRVF